MSNSHTSQTAAAPVVAGARDAAVPERLPSRRRWFMLSLLLIATIINYIDRVNISIAAPFLAKDLGLDKIEMGLIFFRVCLDLRDCTGARRLHRRSLRFPVHLRGVADQLVDRHRVPGLGHGLRFAVRSAPGRRRNGSAGVSGQQPGGHGVVPGA
nr:hypothetical protein GCM10020185_59050 [Pseudomonas brassicacearum subsp. brassicacearum]